MRTSLFIFFMVIFIGCSENDIIDEGEKPEDPQAEIEVYYDQESTSSRKPDAGAKVYLYYNINITTAFGGLASYEGNGILKYKRHNTTTVQRNYPIGSVDLNRNHSSDVLV